MVGARGNRCDAEPATASMSDASGNCSSERSHRIRCGRIRQACTPPLGQWTTFAWLLSGLLIAACNSPTEPGEESLHAPREPRPTGPLEPVSPGGEGEEEGPGSDSRLLNLDLLNASAEGTGRLLASVTHRSLVIEQDIPVTITMQVARTPASEAIAFVRDELATAGYSLLTTDEYMLIVAEGNPESRNLKIYPDSSRALANHPPQADETLEGKRCPTEVAASAFPEEADSPLDHLHVTPHLSEDNEVDGYRLMDVRADDACGLLGFMNGDVVQAISGDVSWSHTDDLQSLDEALAAATRRGAATRFLIIRRGEPDVFACTVH